MPTVSVAKPIQDVIERADEAEIAAFTQLDATPFECCYTGSQLSERRALVANLKAVDR